MQKKTWATLWVGSVVLAGSWSYHLAPKKIVEVEKKVATERVVIKEKYYSKNSDRPIKERIITKDRLKVQDKRKETPPKAPNWAITGDYYLNGSVDASLEYRLLGPVWLRGGVMAGPQVGVIPHIGLRLEFNF